MCSGTVRRNVQKFDPIGKTLGLHKISNKLEDSVIDSMDKGDSASTTTASTGTTTVAESGLDNMAVASQGKVSTVSAKKTKRNQIRQGIASNYTNQIEEN